MHIATVQYCACISSAKAEINLFEESSRTMPSENFTGELLKRPRCHAMPPKAHGLSFRLDVSFCARITSMSVLTNLYNQSQAHIIAAHFADPCFVGCFSPSFMSGFQLRNNIINGGPEPECTPTFQSTTEASLNKLFSSLR